MISFLTPVYAAGGAVVTSSEASQADTVMYQPSLYYVTVGSSIQTTATYKDFTQTFASTYLGTWAYATPSSGSIGLGSIVGTVGAVRG